jgi:hypothetical protein
MKTFGFSLLRNGVKYDYPFCESLKSLAPLVESITLALGDSDDGTEKKIADLGLKIDVIPTTWDEEVRKSGIILSQQTNVALDRLRSEHGGEDDAWGIYLQSDEVFHEDDHALILEDIKKAQAQGCDAVRFRWLHFWHRYDNIAISWWWYPSEIRAIKLKSKIESYGDAQSFRNFNKVYESQARVFHYGYVREETAFSLKVNDFHRWWHTTERSLKKAQNKFEKRAKTNELIKYLGPHPLTMKSRVGGFAYPVVEEIGIVGRPSDFSPEFIKRIRAKKIHWSDSLLKLKGNYPKVVLRGAWWENLLSNGFFPRQSRSKLATPWSAEFLATLLLSRKNICVGDGPRPQ